MADPSALPVVFVCGNSRSGTTMMGRILGRHPSVHTFRELHYFEQLWEPVTDPPPISQEAATSMAARLLAIEASGHRTPVPAADHADAARACLGPGPHDGARIYAAVVEAVTNGEGAVIGCDQTPRNVYVLPTLLELFPRSHAVVMVRDPRDVALSQKHRWNRTRRGQENMSRWDSARAWAGYHPLLTTRIWRSGIVALERVIDHPRVHTVRFEDLVDEPDATLEPVFAALSLDYDEAYVGVPRTGSSHGAGDASETGIDPSAARRWQRGGLDPVELATIDRVCGELASTHGYERTSSRPSVTDEIVLRAALVPKIVAATVLNARRVGNPVTAVRRRFGNVRASPWRSWS